ncbi:MAG: 2-amino-4-hydroxy-6-hydroxymethyldihydropteridine diphosphokinase/dihydropteroate synthase [Saprospiraceae bacterium]
MIYLGLGSNLGDRRQNLQQAIELLAVKGFTAKRCSPIVESPAWLTPEADPKWNKPYLNLVLEGQSETTPQALLKLIKEIEQQLGRNLNNPRWSPRPIDIDILVWEDLTLNTENLTIPHMAATQRPFVITPLVHLNPGLLIANKTVYQHSLKLRPIPLWMGIVNVTPDSFSDGGASDDEQALEKKLNNWLDEGIHVLDVGAESTRPNAQALTPDEEWQRLQPALTLIQKLIKPLHFKPIISIDTRHAEVADKALGYGLDWLNDVTGLNDKNLQKLTKQEGIQAVAMHSLSVPVIPSDVLDPKQDSVEQVAQWLEQKRLQWLAAGLDLGRIIFDPGIGFGKTSLQNQALLKSCAALRSLGFRLMMGHSRKSFMNELTKTAYGNRDIETLGVSMALCQQGVDVIRVHEPISHMRAYRAWTHIQN